jgi:hypothetical protein
MFQDPSDYRPLDDDELDELVNDAIEDSASDMRDWRSQLKGQKLEVWQNYVEREHDELSPEDQRRLARAIWHHIGE